MFYYPDNPNNPYNISLGTTVEGPGVCVEACRQLAAELTNQKAQFKIRTHHP